MAANAQGGGNSIEFITMATTGNAKRFGDLFLARAEILAGGTSNNIRALFGGGSTSTVIDFVKIASEGNSNDFGDLTLARSNTAGVSNAHGGLS